MTKRNASPILTFQTRIDVRGDAEAALTQTAALLSKVERSLLAAILASKTAGQLKTPYLKAFGITARQFNGCRVQVEGRIQSLKERNKQRIQDCREAILRCEQKLKKKRLPPYKAFSTKRILVRRQNKLARLLADQKAGIVRLCLGSSKLFRQQFHLEDSPYADHQEWTSAWQQKRNSSFFTLGSKDETGGNQTCTATLVDGHFTLRLRLPNALGKYLLIKGVSFAYGQETLEQALALGQAISYRFQKDKKGWRVFASTAPPQPQWASNERSGGMGVDINADHLALVETDRFGNFVNTHTIPLNTYGKSKEQSRALIGDACAQVVALAQAAQKPLVVEKLDFQKKKKSLREGSAKQARMLSSLSYRAILQTLSSRAFKHGIQVHEVNPAYTSLIGRVKFAHQYGLTTHQAAALSIARRYQKYSETLPSQAKVPDGKGGHFAFSLPVRNGKNSEWRFFGEALRKLQAALAEHFRVAVCQSSDPPVGSLR